MHSLDYRPEIDGLRAVAVIPVILFHMDFDWMPGGFVGVDVFFIISGFLITSLILKEYKASSFTLRNFWARRIRRILPALLTMIAVTSIVGFFLLYKNEHPDLGRHGLSTLFSVTNIHMWLLTRDYWGPQAENSFFLHAWSLSVEEQFYLAFPILALFFLKWMPQHFAKITLIATILGYITFAYNAKAHPNAAFYLLPSRFWELSMGCSLALYCHKVDQVATRVNFLFTLLSWTGLCLILISYTHISGEDGLSWNMIMPTLGATLVIACTGKTKFSQTRLLSAQPLVFIGKISYSLYLWHWPILLYYRDSGYETPLLAKAATIGTVAAVSYFLIEKPTRRRPAILPFLALAFFACSSIAAYLSLRQGNYDVSEYDKVIWAGPRYDVTPGQKPWDETMQRKMMGIHTIPRPSSDYDALGRGGIIMQYGSETPAIMLLGDSHSLMWAPILDDIAHELNTTISFCGMDACPPVFLKNHDQPKYHYNLKTLTYIKKWKPIVIISARWSFWHGLNLEDTVERISKNNGNIILIQQPPELFFGDKNAPQHISLMGIEPKEGKHAFIPAGNNAAYSKGAAKIRTLSAIHDNCEHIEIADLFLNEDGNVKILSGKQVLYIDDDHLSFDGAILARERLFQAIAQSLTRRKQNIDLRKESTDSLFR
jgi:peptidoglycan/LPS O-acetylase OafA/YrhL